MRGSLTLGHIRGIPIRAHFSLLLAVPYIAFLMSVRFDLVAEQAGLSEASLRLPPIAWGLVFSVALFGCVLLHELGHSLVALRRGGKVSSITLMLLGGVSELHNLPRSPRTEGLVAIAGPLVSFGLGIGALALRSVLPGPADLQFGLFYMGQLNLVLGIFNLLPAFPMDGGRVLRALLAWKMSRVQATRWAARAGMVFAALFVLLGLAAGNLLLALIGLFVWAGAAAERDAVEREESFRGLFVSDVMSPVKATVESWESVSEAAGLMATHHVTALPVLDQGLLSGVVGAHHVEALRVSERFHTPVRAIVDTAVPRLHAGEPLAVALERMAEKRVAEAPVLEEGELVGILEAENLGRVLRLRRLSATGRQDPSIVRMPRPVEPRRPEALHRDQPSWR